MLLALFWTITSPYMNKTSKALHKYRFKETDKLFFTSDTHFGHTKIIGYANRPFDSVEEMDEMLIRNWNETVPEDGIVFHLGDFCFGNNSRWKAVLEQLNGQKYLILGNHDYKNFPPSCDHYFKRVTQQLHIYVDGQEIYLNHHPFLTFGGAYGQAWQLYGHVHSGPRDPGIGLDYGLIFKTFSTQYDVGVDNNNYRPVSYTEVKKIIAERSKLYYAAMAERITQLRQEGVESLPLEDPKRREYCRRVEQLAKIKQ